MAVCGLLSMLRVPPIQPDMDSCPGRSSGVTRNHLKFWQSGSGPRASSCLSSTMVDHNDRDDSGSSQSPTPTRTLSESKQLMVTRDNFLPRPELELSISLNDGKRSSPPRFKSVKDEFDFSPPSSGRKDTLGRSAGVEEEATFSGSPRKRARMSPLGFRVEENQVGSVREQFQLYPFETTSSDVTGGQRSLPAFRSTEREPSPSPSRGASSGSKPPTSWWLGPGPRNSAMITSETHHFQAIDGRGMIPGTSLQERDLPFKEPSFYPNMLSSMEVSEQVSRGGRSQEPGRLEILRDPPEHPFFSREEGSTSLLSSASTASEETVPRPDSAFFSKDREAPFHSTNTSFGQQNQHPFELQGGRKRHSSDYGSQHLDLGMELVQGSFGKLHQLEQKNLPQGDQGSALRGSPSGNANTTFYARILDAAQQPVSSPLTEAVYAGAFNSSLSFSLAGQSLPRAYSQIGAGTGQFRGEFPSIQPANNEALRNLLAAHPSIGSIPPFMSQVPVTDPARLSFPNLSSLDFIQSLQRQSFPPQGTDRHRQSAPGHNLAGTHPPPQGLSFLSALQSSQYSLPVELNPSLPRGSKSSSLQPSPGLRDFLSCQGPKGSSSLGLGHGPPTGPLACRGSVPELPTHLSLQAPAILPPLTVVMEGRSIGRRISLQDYDGYDRFATAMRAMFDSHVSSHEPTAEGECCTLVNAIPGYVIAYEDEEGDVLLAGDLPWRNFVRMAKQIRIVSSSKISFKLPNVPSRS